MKFKITTWASTFLLLAVTFPLLAQKNVSGGYVAYNTDTSTILLLRLAQKDTNYSARIDLPLAKIMDAPAKNVKRKGDTLNIYLAQPQATITALLAGNSITSATWKQIGDTQKLTVKPLLRPQTPQAPFPYLADSVEYDNADKTVHLGATITRPKDATAKVPAIILITGSGLEDRDENLFEHRSFAIIADFFTKKGVAVLRVDDRMKGKSKGDVMKATSATFAEDVLTSLAWLKKQPYIDTAKIGLMGHSEGSMIAAMAYNQWPHFTFIVSLAGAGVPGSAILLRQQTDPLKTMVSPAAYTAYYQLEQQKFAAFDKYYNSDSLAAITLASSFETWKKQYPDSLLAELNANTATGAMYAMQMRMELANPWLKYFMHADPATYWQKVACPVLIFNGANDTQVNAAENTTAIKTAIEKSGNHQVTTLVFPGLNHLFQHSTTGQFAEYALIEESFAPGVLSVAYNWLRNLQIVK